MPEAAAPLAEATRLLRQALDEAQAVEASLRAELDAQRSEVAKLRRALDIMEPRERVKRRNTTPSSVGVRRSNGTATGMGISVEACVPIAAFCMRAGDTFVQKEVTKGLDIDQSKTSAAFKYLRSIGFLRKAGSEPDGRSELWAVDNRDALNKALEAAQKAVTA